MPELPEVEVVRRGLAPHVTGRRLTRLEIRRGDLRFPVPAELPALLVGRRCLEVSRRAKYLLFGFEGGVLLAWHLGMTGQFHVLPSAAPRGAHEHLCLRFGEGTTLRYRDARRFGYVGALAAEAPERHPWFRELGVEPLHVAFDADYLIRAAAGRRRPVKTLLMDARVVVGIGNIYAVEALHRAGIHPGRAAGRISAARLSRLVEEVRTVLAEAIEAGGSSISDFVRADGRPGYFAHRFAVYDRAGEACGRCGAGIRRIVVAGRGTFYCPGCQR